VNIPAGAGRIDLGFDVPASGQYSIGLNQADLYRNNQGASYPYDIAGLMSLTGSSAQSGGDFYYYFYDIEVSEAACWSDSVPVVATISDTADFSYSSNNLTFNFTDLTQGSASWAWNFGDGNTSTLQNPTHTYGATGVYTVTLVVDGGSCTVTYQIGVGVNIGIEDLEKEGLNIQAFPNPASEELNVAFNKPLGYATKARIYALNGKLIKEVEIDATDEAILVPLDGVISNLYVLEIDLADGKYHQKITVMK
jgi:PKD repeat protein